MTRVTRQRTTTRVPAQRNPNLLDRPPHDYTTLPDSPMRRRFTATRPSTQTTEIIPVVEETIVLRAVRNAQPTSESSRPQPAPQVSPAETAFWRRAAEKMFTVLLPPRKRTYQGGISDLPAPSLWDRLHDTDDWPDQEVPSGRHGHRSDAAGPDADTPHSLPVAHIRDSAMALHHAPRVDAAGMMRQADDAARANDERIARFSATADGWLDGHAERVQELKKRLAEAKAQADAAEIARRVAAEDAAHPAVCDTMAAGMFEAAKMRADLDAMLAENPAVSA